MGNSLTLHSACAYGDLTGVKKLLTTCTEADLEAKDENGCTPLLVAVAAMRRKNDEDDEDLDMFGFSDDLDDDDEERGDMETRTVDKQSRESTGGDDSAPEEVEELQDDASIEPIEKETEILHLLIQKKVNLDHCDENGWTALHHACYIQHPAAIKMLVHAGAHPMREGFGLLPQDLLMRGQASEWTTQAQEMKELLDQITDKTPYSIRLLAFRPSGIVQLNLGAQVEKGSFVTIEYDVPENHSPKDYIQVLISPEDSPEIEIGSYHHVPAGAHGQITISTKDIPSSSTIRFVYIKTDINKLARQVVASGCNAVVQASVGEIFQYELYLYERVVEVESVPEFEFIDQPLIVLKRIGIVVNESEIDWAEIRPDNHIVAVNDIRIDTMEFGAAVQVLQENNGKKCTKLLMQNYSACGDFIPEKILGVGVVGKYAFLNAVHDQAEHPPVSEHKLDDWVAAEAHTRASSATEPTSAASVDAEAPQITPLHAALDSRLVLADGGENPVEIYNYEDTINSPSTIETVMPLPNSRFLVEQLQVGIAKSVK